MKNQILLISAIISVLIAGCSSFSTRVEKDIYTISERDTLTIREQKNLPGLRDNGIIYPSSRAINTSRTVIQRDSVVEREYPDFIRLGIFESVGLIGSGKENSAGTGVFGIFPDLENLKSTYKGNSSKVFNGGIYRFGVGEWRLRWFRDASNWTFGTNMLEIMMPDARVERTLTSIFPLYLRKRFYVSESTPYMNFTLAFGIGYYPSQYFNFSGSFDIGSIGGLNLRAYAGFAAGMNSKSSYAVRLSENNSAGQTVAFPYLGVGISFLDFHNLVKETNTEWKDHKHYSWNVGLIQAGILAAGSDSSALSEKSKSNIISGALIRLANASVALPFLNNGFYLGTSLANFMILGRNEWGLGILPIRLGYWQTILSDELSTEPFIEYNYYPSKLLHIGNRVNLRISNFLNVGLIMGFVTGGSSIAVGSDLSGPFGVSASFSRPYLGVSLGFGDRIFFDEEIVHNKQK